jgi:hypothetical protein
VAGPVAGFGKKKFLLVGRELGDTRIVPGEELHWLTFAIRVSR